MPALKMYSLTTMQPHGVELDQPAHVRQCTVRVVTTSKTAAVRALVAAGLHTTLHEFNTYGSITPADDDRRDVTVVAEHPGHVFIYPLKYRDGNTPVDLTARST